MSKQDDLKIYMAVLLFISEHPKALKAEFLNSLPYSFVTIRKSREILLIHEYIKEIPHLKDIRRGFVYYATVEGHTALENYKEVEISQ